MKKQAVFRHPGECLRSSISFNHVLKRYLWWQLLPSSADDGRFDGGFAIYDAPADGTALWSETQLNVNVEGGLFEVSLGSNTPLSASVFDSDANELHLIVINKNLDDAIDGTFNITSPQNFRLLITPPFSLNLLFLIFFHLCLNYFLLFISLNLPFNR